MKTKRNSRFRKIIFWAIGILIGILITIGAVGYFYWSKLIKGTLEEAVKRGTNGLYRAEIGNLYYGIFDGDLYIHNFSLLPDTAVYNTLNKTDSAPPSLIMLQVNNLEITDIGLKDAVFNRQARAAKIRIKLPELTIWRMKEPVKEATGKPGDTLLSIPLPEGWDFISIEEISLEEGTLKYIDLTADTATEFCIPSFDIRILNLRIDSTWEEDPRIYNTDNILITLRGIRQLTGNRMYAMNFGEIGLSTGKNTLLIKQFHLEPLFDKHDFSRKLGYQTDRMDIVVGSILLSGINLRELMQRKRFIAGKLQVDGLVLDDYRDKRVSMRPDYKPPMPQDLIRKLKPYIRIDTLELTNGKATYSEQVVDEPGTIFFDRIHATLTGLTNDSAWLAENRVSSLKGEAYLQGTGKLEAQVDFKFGDPKNRFTLSAFMSTFDLRQINPMLSKLLPAEVKSGRINKLVVPRINFTDHVATGRLTLYYENLKFILFDEKQTTWSGIKTEIINFVANDLTIPGRNPGANGKLRTGIVYFQRDKHKSIINFIWKSILSGVKSNIGLNSRDQKEIKKREK
ncbi:MAG: DUF748 domain-containing protein [bacterium]